MVGLSKTFIIMGYEQQQKIDAYMILDAIQMSFGKLILHLLKEIRERFGEPDIIQIRKTFPDRADDAVLWEHRVLRKMKVIHKESWLNETDNKAWLMDEERKKKLSEIHMGKTLSKDHREAIGKSLAGGKRSEETKEKLRQIAFKRDKSNYGGKPLSEEHKKKLSDMKKGKPLSEEHKKKLSEAAKNRKRNGNKGIKFNEEWKQKLSEAAKNRWKRA